MVLAFIVCEHGFKIKEGLVGLHPERCDGTVLTYCNRFNVHIPVVFGTKYHAAFSGGIGHPQRPMERMGGFIKFCFFYRCHDS